MQRSSPLSSTIKIDNNTAVAYINMGADYADTLIAYHVML